MVALLPYPPVDTDQSLSQPCDSVAKFLRTQAVQSRCGKVRFERVTLGTGENFVDRLMVATELHIRSSARRLRHFRASSLSALQSRRGVNGLNRCA
jgi:hypothetical protein